MLLICGHGDAISSGVAPDDKIDIHIYSARRALLPICLPMGLAFFSECALVPWGTNISMVKGSVNVGPGGREGFR